MDTVKEATETDTKLRFLPIYLDSLVVDTILEFDLFVKLGRQMMLYRSKRLPFSEGSRQKLLGNSVTTIFVKSDQRHEYQRYIEQNLGSILINPHVPEQSKAGIVYDTSKALVKDVLEKPTLGENIKRSRSLVEHQISYILSGREAFLNLVRITSFDYYTYTHSVNVSTFTIALANELGISDPNEIYALGLGSLLHDVGKSRISDKILNKKDSLNKAEFDIMKKHPGWGKEILRETDILEDEAYFPVTQHHERLDGSGYPEGLNSSSIHPHGKIIAICDVFDAMTTQRVYQDAMASYSALKKMMEMKDKFDRDILERFIKLMGPA